MARFFQNLDSDEKQVKNKTAQLGSSFGDDEQPEKTNKLDEIAGRVDDVLGSGSSFAKLAKRLLVDLKRCTKTEKYERLPAKISILFNDERFKRSSQLTSQAAEIMKNFTEEQTAFVKNGVEIASQEITGSKGGKNKKVDELELIFGIISDEEKEERLLKYLADCESDDDKCAIAQALFSIYNRQESSDRMLWVLEEFEEPLRSNNSEHARRFRNTPDKYLRKIYEHLNPNEYDRYRNVLVFISGFNKEAADYALLQLQFFKLSLNPSTEHPKFKLLHCVRLGDWSRALDLFVAEGCSFYDCEVLLEFADLAMATGAFSTAFDVLSYCKSKNEHNLTVKIYALCVILNKKISSTPAFLSFIEAFKAFDQNPLLLKSQNPVEEIFRAFYLLHMLDYSGAAKIINAVAEVECTDELRDYVTCLLKQA